MRLVMIAVAGVLLSGCGKPGLSEKQQDEASAIAYKAAFHSIEDSSTIDELDTRIAELEEKVEELEGRLDKIGSD